jgi:antitoxin component of MazEF toxin-antitoxin module
MATLKVHHQGWLSLPERFRQKLGVTSGGEIEAELVDGTIVLRPSKGSAKAVQEGVATEAAQAMPAPSVLAAQVEDAEQPATTPDTPPAPKRRGRPPKAKA